MIQVFMGQANAASLPQNSANSGVGQEDNLNAAGTGAGAGTKAAAAKSTKSNNNKARQNKGGGLLAGLLGGLGGGGGAAAQGVQSTGPPETMIKATAGAGAQGGLPTANNDGTVDLTFRQVRFFFFFFCSVKEDGGKKKRK